MPLVHRLRFEEQDLVSLDPEDNVLRYMLFSPFYVSGNWRLEQLDDFPKVKLLELAEVRL